MHDIFLSHNSADKPAVEALALRLRAAGIEPWLDKWNLIPGNPWQQEIEQAIDTCKVCAVFIGPSGVGPWQDEEMRAAIDRRVSQGNFRVIPVLLPGATRSDHKRSSLPTFLTATTWVEFRDTLGDEDAFHRLLAGIRGIAPGAVSGGDGFTADECPYRGLQVFDVEHAPLFFGRRALTEWLLEAIRPEEGKANRFLAMLGASGSGKSSLARAGLLAPLQKGELADSQHWPQIILKPGAKPLESLAVALCHAGVTDKNQGELIELFQQNDSQLHWLCRQALHGQPDNSRIVVLVDQFEEVFTLCHDDDECTEFINNLLTAATDVTGQA
ncbi:MAG: TIR domain-containing protein, partial [Thiolinea sp.]